MELMNIANHTTDSLAERVFADPIEYLASFGIAAVLVTEHEERLPEAA